jgi:hypothetical protein
VTRLTLLQPPLRSAAPGINSALRTPHSHLADRLLCRRTVRCAPTGKLQNARRVIASRQRAPVPTGLTSGRVQGLRGGSSGMKRRFLVSTSQSWRFCKLPLNEEPCPEIHEIPSDHFPQRLRPAHPTRASFPGTESPRRVAHPDAPGCVRPNRGPASASRAILLRSAARPVSGRVV